MKTHSSILIIFMVLIFKYSWSQDPLYSNFFANRLTLNPAYAGDDGRGKLRVASLHRNLYRSVKGPFNATCFGMDYGLCNNNIGVGILASNETQGDGFLNSNYIGGIISIRKDLGKTCYGAVGFQLAYLSQTIDWNNFVFSDQLDPVYGITQLSSNQNLNRQFSGQKDMNLGGIVKWWNWNSVNTIGLNVSHAPVRTHVGFLSDYLVPVRISLHYGYFYKPNPGITANAKELQVRIDKQRNAMTVVLNFNWFIHEKVAVGSGIRACYYGGPFFLNTQNLLFNIALQPMLNFKIIVGYEAGVGGINSWGGGNCFELALIYIPSSQICAFNTLANSFRLKGKVKSGATPCPVFNKAGIIAPF